MSANQKMREWMKIYKELILFLLFSLFCALEAAGKGALNEFGNIEFWLMLFGVILMVGAEQLGANKRLLMAVFVLATVGNLIHACQEVYFFHADVLREAGKVAAEDYKSVNMDYILGFLTVLAVLILYPRLHKILSNDFAVFGMAMLTFAIYGLLLAGGQSVGGVRAWFHGIQLTEFVKILFVFVIAGLLSKKQSFVRSGLAVLYMCGNVVCLGIISEYGTLIVMGIVFLIFLFIFPNKLWWLGFVLLIGTTAVILLFSFGSGFYNEALAKAPAEKFAAVFAGQVRDVTDSEGNTVSGTDKLRQMAEDHLEGLSEAESTDFEAAIQKLSNGSVTQADFRTATEEEKAAGQEPDGVGMLAVLSENAAFRSDYIQTFCKNEFWGNTAMGLYREVGHGLVHKLKAVVLGLYNKCVQRFVIPLFPADLQERLLGVRDMDNSNALYQTAQAARAMRLGGLTGAGGHEFIYIAVMESDMIFASIVSFFGFAMGFFVILMNMIMFREGIRIQRSLETTRFHQGIALGLTLMLFAQAMFIIGGNLGVFPLTGITLPFIAAGTTSMLICFAMVGLLMTVSFISVTEKNRQADNQFKDIWFLIKGMFRKTVRGTGRGFGKGIGKMYKIVMDDLEKNCSDDDDIEESESGDSTEWENDSAESISEAVMRKAAKAEKDESGEHETEGDKKDSDAKQAEDDEKDARMHRGRMDSRHTIYDAWNEEGEDDDAL